MYTVKAGNKKVALKFEAGDIKEGLSFFSVDKDYIQVGGWRYNKRKKLSAHIHNLSQREVNRTQEFIYVVYGSVRASIYDENEKHLENLILKPNEGLILFSGGHGYEILEDNTVVIEVKNGPYPGPDKDRRRFGNEE